MVRRLRQMEAILAIAGQRRVDDRLYQLLLLLQQEFGQPVVEGTRLNIRLTHQDIANAICTTRVTVTRMLGKLQQQGLIGRDGDLGI
jgi:CRP-like cAMP-binding protein